MAQVERLDLVAKAEAIKASLSKATIPLAILATFLVLLAIFAGASFYEMLAVRVTAVLAVGVAVLVWLSSRYAPIALVILLCAVLLGGWFFDSPDYHTFLGSTTRYVISAMILFWGYRWTVSAISFLAAQSSGFDEERSRVHEWMEVLQDPQETDSVVEFSSGSFWAGYWTYRVLRAGSFWVIERFANRKLARTLSFRVLESAAIRVTDGRLPKVEIEIGNRSVAYDVSHDVRDRLLSLSQSK